MKGKKTKLEEEKKAGGNAEESVRVKAVPNVAKIEKVAEAKAAGPEAEAVTPEADEIIEVPKEEIIVKAPERAFDVVAWQPKTALGMLVKEGKITLDEILEKGLKITEPEIIDALMPGYEVELINIGQSKGKFGGGSRKAFKQTQKKTPEGNKPSFAVLAVVGNRNGCVGIGYGKAKDTLPSKGKAIKQAKMNVFKIKTGCGSWQCHCKGQHSIPFLVEGKSGSVRIRLMPAPKGKGLCADAEVSKVLRLAGIRDVWSRSFGQTGVKLNHIKACESALKSIASTRIRAEDAENIGLKE